MADYYPLIARAVAGLEKNTGEARRALYERARTALVTQLRGVEPALNDADITRERLALEEAIRKVEAEAARRPRQDLPPVQTVPPPRFEKPPSFTAPPPRPSPPPPPPPPPPPAPEPESEIADTPPADWRELQKELDSLAPPPQARTYEPETPVDEPPSPQRAEPRVPGEHPSLVDEGLKGFRDVMAESDDLGSAAASASKSARETRDAFSELPPAGGVERIEPHIEPRFGPEDLKPSKQELPLPPPSRREAGAGRKRPAPPRPPGPEEFDEQELSLRRTGRSFFAKVVVLAAVLLLGAAAVFAYLRWGSSLTAMFQSSPQQQAAQASKDTTPQARPKIADRVGGQQDSRPAGGNAAAVAQRALLYEIGANPQERKQYVGSVIWRTETSSAGPGQAPDMAVKAEVEIPERQMRMSFVVRRNLDQTLPASHTVEILFSTPADFSAGGVADIAAVLLGDERGAGVPLTGLRVKVTNGFFLVGLSSVEDVVKRNMQLLKTRPWVHLQTIYNNGQPALLLLEKGVPGDRAFEDALNAWGQNPPQ